MGMKALAVRVVGSGLFAIAAGYAAYILYQSAAQGLEGAAFAVFMIAAFIIIYIPLRLGTKRPLEEWLRRRKREKSN
jgi:hypothetical protein